MIKIYNIDYLARRFRWYILKHCEHLYIRHFDSLYLDWFFLCISFLMY